MRPTKLLPAGLIGLTIVIVFWRSEAHESDQIKVALKNRAGTVITALTDGDLVKLNVTLTNAASKATEVIFELAPSNKPIGKCTVPSGAKSCDAESILALWWLWRKFTRRKHA
jgi:hypothetical protein